MFNLLQVVKDTVKTDWKDVLLEDSESIRGSELLEEIGEKLRAEYVDKFDSEIPFYPPQSLVFNAFNRFNIADTKVVLIGMDPYHRAGQAMGLSFSVPENVKVPPSLRNIYKELITDLEIDTSSRNGDLTHWADQGVLLLNASLTVRERKAGSHMKYWKKYTDALIQKVSEKTDSVVFILWGNFAKGKEPLIDSDKHHILKGVHPSPLSASRGFFGCKHFSKCNALLLADGKEPIDW